MQVRWMFLDSGERTGAENMTVDEALARELAAGTGRPTFRLFQWHPWAISLGHHQDSGEINAQRAAADGIDVVRRPTGGRAILHADELTYSVTMPAGRRGILQVYNAISKALVRGLRQYGVDVALQKSQPDFAVEYRNPSSIPCFSSSARYEIEWRGRKLVGSAQRRFSGPAGDVVLQHGSILCGPAHVRLAEYLAIHDAALLGRIRRTLEERTAHLAAITGAEVDFVRLASCLRRGFEEEWGISFTPASREHLHAQSAHAT
ncbi:MAG: lipoate--protein ligase family protein [Bacteroidota bacterium]